VLTSDTSVVYLLLSDKYPAVAACIPAGSFIPFCPSNHGCQADVDLSLGRLHAYIMLPRIAMILVFYPLIHTFPAIVN
jgi:hypothetical protein